MRAFERILKVDPPSLGDRSTQDLVGMATVLTTTIKQAEVLLSEIKKHLRQRALLCSGGAPGTVKLPGRGEDSASVQVLPPKVRLRKDADIQALQRTLGSDMNLYFEPIWRVHSHTVDLILQMPEGSPRDLLLSSLEEVAETPRVSFL